MEPITDAPLAAASVHDNHTSPPTSTPATDLSSSSSSAALEPRPVETITPNEPSVTSVISEVAVQHYDGGAFAVPQQQQQQRQQWQGGGRGRGRGQGYMTGSGSGSGRGRGRGRGSASSSHDASRPKRNAAAQAQQAMANAEQDELDYKAEQKAVRAARKLAKKRAAMAQFGSSRLNSKRMHHDDDDDYGAWGQHIMKSLSVTDIMRQALPPGTTISDDAKAAVQRAVDEFVCFVTHEACDTVQYERTKQVSSFH
jgi:histone H3/H4